MRALKILIAILAVILIGCQPIDIQDDQQKPDVENTEGEDTEKPGDQTPDDGQEPGDGEEPGEGDTEEPGEKPEEPGEDPKEDPSEEPETPTTPEEPKD